MCLFLALFRLKKVEGTPSFPYHFFLFPNIIKLIHGKEEKLEKKRSNES